MANRVKGPGDRTSEPIESRRAKRSKADPSRPLPEIETESSSVGLPEFGELFSEAARPTPLDEVAEAERENAPRD